jgi:transcriptional/translational regulatory protein YebC/TACO1
VLIYIATEEQDLNYDNIRYLPKFVYEGMGFSPVKVITSCLSDEPTLKVTDLEQVMPLDPHGTFC